MTNDLISRNWLDDDDSEEIYLDDENDEEDDFSDVDYGNTVYFGLDDEDDDHPDETECPECESNNVVYTGGDNIVNVSGPLMSRVEFYECRDCGHKFSL